MAARALDSRFLASCRLLSRGCRAELSAFATWAAGSVCNNRKQDALSNSTWHRQRDKTHQVHFDVAGVSLVWVNSTMGSVRSSVCLWCLVDDNVLDDELFGLEPLSLCVGLCILEQVQEEFDRLDRPST